MNARTPRTKAAAQIAALTLAHAVTLFAPAGTLLWWNAWVFIAVTLLISVLTLSAFARTPGLYEERLTAKAKAETWDRAFVIALGGLPFVVNALAGFDHRYAWTRGFGTVASLAGLLPMLAGIGLIYRAMLSNPFFSSHIRIQSDRGHTVASGGPYAHLRHPGYAGAILYNLALPLLLGSPIASVPALAAALLVVVRTWLEDRVLIAELPGYREYAARVRYRLLPYLW